MRAVVVQTGNRVAHPVGILGAGCACKKHKVACRGTTYSLLPGPPLAAPGPQLKSAIGFLAIVLIKSKKNVFLKVVYSRHTRRPLGLPRVAQSMRPQDMRVSFCVFFVFFIFRASVNDSYTHATLGGRRASLGRPLNCVLATVTV